MTIFVNQELGEVPLDAIPKDATFAGFKEFVDRRSIVAIYINLIQKDYFISDHTDRYL